MSSHPPGTGRPALAVVGMAVLRDSPPHSRPLTVMHCRARHHRASFLPGRASPLTSWPLKSSITARSPDRAPTLGPPAAGPSVRFVLAMQAGTAPNPPWPFFRSCQKNGRRFLRSS